MPERRIRAVKQPPPPPPPPKLRRRKSAETAPVAPAPPPLAALAVEYLPLAELEHWPRNPKRHDYDGIKASIRRWGFVLPVVVDEGTRRLVAGHGRQEALSQMLAAGEQPPSHIGVDGAGRWLVPVIRGNHFASEEEAEKYLIADNRFVEVGGWDSKMLTSMLRDFKAPDLKAIGFDDDALARLAKLAAEGDFVEQLGSMITSDDAIDTAAGRSEASMFVVAITPKQSEVIYGALKRAKLVAKVSNNVDALTAICTFYLRSTTNEAGA